MAVTAIWSVKGDVETVIRYTANPSKTWNENYEQAASYHALENVMTYSADEMKTEKQLSHALLMKMQLLQIILLVLIMV